MTEASAAPSASTVALPSEVQPPKRSRGAAAGGARRRARGGHAAASAALEADGGASGDEDSGAVSPAAKGAAAEDSDESDREDVDWEGHGAEGIFALGPRDKVGPGTGSGGEAPPHQRQLCAGRAG